MDPFTERMLERARARREKIDSQLANNGHPVTPHKPLATDNKTSYNAAKNIKSPERKESSLARRPSKGVPSPPTKRQSGGNAKIPVKSNNMTTPVICDAKKKEVYTVGSPSKGDLREVCVTRTEYLDNERTSDVSVEINIVHRDDVTIQVQVEEEDAPIVVHTQTQGVKKAEAGKNSDKGNEVSHIGRSGLRQNAKSRLDRLGVLYSDKLELSSPIHRTECEFTSETPPHDGTPAAVKPSTRPTPKGRLPRLAALANTINNWEDDLSHHKPDPKASSKTGSQTQKEIKAEESTLDVSIHSLGDINRAVDKNKKTVNEASTMKKSTTASHLNDSTVAALEPRKMATAVAAVHSTVVKKPSIKKYKAPTPPRRLGGDDPKTDSQNNLVDEVNENVDTAAECKQTNGPIGAPHEKTSNHGSPISKRTAVAPKLNGYDGETGSVASKAALFENGSPFQRDPTTMSIRERKALFEKNKGAAIVPKAPFGQAPSAKMLQSGAKAEAKPVRPLTTSAAIAKSSSKSNTSLFKSRESLSKSSTSLAKSTTSLAKSITSLASFGKSKENIAKSRDNLAKSKEKLTKSRESLAHAEGGIKGKLQALLNKGQTISEATIEEKNRKERQQELEMLQNRFQYKAKSPSRNDHESDSDTETPDVSENAPLMGSTVSLHHPVNVKSPVTTNLRNKCKSETALHSPGSDVNDGGVVGSQPAKRRSSQDSPVVLSVLDDVKRIKMAEPHGQERLYPHLSDIETNTDDESCAGSMDNVSDKGRKNMNTSENWAETSFGRDMMKTITKKSVKPTVSFSLDVTANTESSAEADSELDELLDEALDEVETPARDKKSETLASSSFTYRSAGSPNTTKTTVQCEFKSPLKTPTTPLRAPRTDKNQSLVHSVSFYRRMQSQTSQPATPVRTVRHTGDETTDDGAEVSVGGIATVTERIDQLRAEICKQQTIISQASQALNLCASTVEFSGSTEQAEGERLLLLATHRRQACLHEIQRLQVEGPGPAAQRGAVSLALHSLSVPLRRDYMRQLNADGATGHYCLCLLKCRDRVLATSMRLTRPDTNHVEFPDRIQMDGLAGDFKVTVEVYLLPASKELLPHDVKYHIHNKKTASRLLTPKGKTTELKALPVQSPGGPAFVRSPRLQPHGYCIFALQQAKRTNFTLNKVPAASPLEGSLSIKIGARLSLPPPAPHSAFLTAFDDVCGLGAWHRRWCVLRAPRLSWWKYPDHEGKKTPMGDLDLTEVVSEHATRAPRDLCARPYTILLESALPAGAVTQEGSLVYTQKEDGSVVRRHLLAADTQEDRDAWLDVLNKALEYVRCNSQDE